MGWFKDACNWVKDKVSSGYNKLKSFFSSWYYAFLDMAITR